MPSLTLTEKSKAATRRCFRCLLWHPAGKWSVSILVCTRIQWL